MANEPEANNERRGGVPAQNGQARDPSMSWPGEPVFMFNTLEVAPGVQLVLMKIGLNGCAMEFVLRPDLALAVAGHLDKHGRHAKSPIAIARDLPPGGRG